MLRTLSIVAILLATVQAWGMDLYLSDTSHVEGDFVKLSHLLESKKHEQRFKSVFLGANSERRRISLRYIQTRLEKSGFFTVKPKLRSGADTLIVKKTAMKVEKKKDIVKVSSTIVPKTKVVEPVSTLTLAKGGEELETPVGRVKEYVTLKESVRRGGLVTASDIEMVSKGRIVNGAIFNREDVIGMQVTKSLRSGTVLVADHLIVPPIIKRGDTVKVIFKSAQIEITGIGKASENGALGDVIQVKRKRDLIHCKILSKNTVQVVNI